MTSDVPETPETDTPTITSQAYHIVVDEGEDDFFALSIERADSETAYLMSDTVRSLEAMR